MTAQRVSMLLAGAAALTLASMPATAQVNDGIVLNILRECAKINDPTARLACYDNNIRSAGAPSRSSVPGSMQRPQGGSGAPLSGNDFGKDDLGKAPSAPSPAPAMAEPEGFGGDDVRANSPQRFDTRPGQVNEIQARVATVREREPGIYLITLDDGAQWLFGESVSRFYRTPRKGDSIELERGALGSYLMRFDNQAPVRIERVK
ncbi:hypothetical protein FHS61_002014 [Altererythrobacter atlanticus]|uniref:Uncharacterized protein n=1 Tax=Croceibacterium atlanticum TaxID=1267766 RepID=A0A0F7KR00_9SPHN|nr:hypothetical protein [Croceibacterium atlanticum]AKH41526.1 hypothetical protein WYH_00467 [Croceibacterium atlanticum]MBB5732988.1 hypothetical protein [Croceibacterium atlanticum]